jgi:hypothetical protein
VIDIHSKKKEKKSKRIKELRNNEVKVRVSFTLEQAMKSRKGIRGIASVFL